MSLRQSDVQAQTPSGSPAGQRGRPANAPSHSEQRTARIMGAWFIGTFVFSIPALWFYEPLLGHANYVVGAGSDTRVGIGALLEILVVISNIATAVVFFPLAKRVKESVALGYVASRIVESVIIAMGIISVLSVVALRQDLAGTSSADGGLLAVGRGLVAFHDQTFLLGPQFCSASTGILLGYLMWRSGLVPRPMAMLGLIGGPLALIGGVGVVLNAWDQPSPTLFALTGAEILWELSLCIWLPVKGFRPSPILTGSPVMPVR